MDSVSDIRSLRPRLVLPASSIGCPRQPYLDSMALLERFGKPDLLMTVACNPSWPEIQQLQHDNQFDEPDLLWKVSRDKLEVLVDELKTTTTFGEVAALIYAVEFQKYQLPHAHFLITFQENFKPVDAEAVNRIISSEIPDSTGDPLLHSMVSDHMLHVHCHVNNRVPSCLRAGRCIYKYPRSFAEDNIVTGSPHPIYHRRDTGRQVVVRGCSYKNGWVIIA